MHRPSSCASVPGESIEVLIDEKVSHFPRRLSPASLILSACLNLLLLATLVVEDFVWREAERNALREVAVELVPEPVKPPPAEPPNPPEPPKEIARPAPSLPPEIPPAPPPLPRLVKPPPPQLVPAPLARQSAAPRQKSPAAAEQQIADGAAALTLGKSDKPPATAAEEGPELTQSEQDFVLGQIMKYWHIDFHAPEAHGLVLEARIVIEPDGTLASPLNKNDPWNPEKVIHGWSEMVRLGYNYRRQAIEGFLLALRICQPLKLPPGGPWPRHMTLRFAFDDM
jgi:hypothetical protein